MSSSSPFVILLLCSLLFFSPLLASARKHGDHHKFGERHSELREDRLTALYSARVQCRRCVRDNEQFINSSSSTAIPTPSYAYQMATQWCPNTLPLANDFDGQCIGMDASCSNRGDNPITSQSYCKIDSPAAKQTCSLCVMDSYAWTFNRFAAKHHDEYNGTCDQIPADLSSVGEWMETPEGEHIKTVIELKDCIKLTTPKLGGLRDMMAAQTFLAVYFWATLLLASCCGVRVCLQRRALAKARAAAMLNGTTVTDTSINSSAQAQFHQPLLPTPLAFTPPVYSQPQSSTTYYNHPQSQLTQSSQNFVTAAVPYSQYPSLAPSAPQY